MKQVNVNLVTKYLALSPHSTAQEIADAAGISKATVLRVIRVVPAIYRSDQYKQAPTYYIDLDEFEDGVAAGLSIAPPVVARDADAEATLKQLLSWPEGITAHAEALVSGGASISKPLELLIKVEHNAKLYQSGQASLDLLQWSKTKESLGKLKVFGYALAYYCEHYLESEVSNTPEFWSLFPKD